jgi:DNA-binding CsgD family transcriptional regulator
VASLQPRAAERSARLLEPSAGKATTRGELLGLAQAAIAAAFAGRPAREVVALAERAWDDGRLLAEDTVDGVAWMMVTSALSFVGELERSLEFTAVVLDDARRRGSPLAFATASVIRSLPELWRGEVSAALNDLEFVRNARRWGWRQYPGVAAANACLCLIEASELDRAEEELREFGAAGQPSNLEDARCLHALAELRMAQGAAREALDAALRAGRVLHRELTVLASCPWRVTAGEAALALGDQARARELASEALAEADRIGVRHARIRAMRLVALCESGDRQLELLQAACDLGAGGPPRLEATRVLIDYGSALRRANHRTAARIPLQRAADQAYAGGAMLLFERARTELVASGARPRRDALLSGPASLTASERRIAELAVAGHSNRDISGMLFVSPKTVEYHLRNVYRKLDIRGRGELPDALSPTSAPPA